MTTELLIPQPTTAPLPPASSVPLPFDIHAPILECRAIRTYLEGLGDDALRRVRDAERWHHGDGYPWAVRETQTACLVGHAEDCLADLDRHCSQFRHSGFAAAMAGYEWACGRHGRLDVVD